jgi:hypothetical protein
MTLPARIDQALARLRRLLRRKILLAGLSRVLLVAVGVTILCFLLDWTFELPAAWRLAFGLLSVGAGLAAAYAFLLRPLLVPMRDDQLALLFERRFPELSSVLVSAVQLAGGGAPASRDMVEAVLEHAESRASDLDPGAVPRLNKLNRLALASVVSLAAVTGAILAGPTAARTFARRYLHPFGPTEWPRHTRLLIEVAGSKAATVPVARGEQVAVKVIARNTRANPMWRPPDTVRLEYRYASGDADAIHMRRIQGPVYKAYFNDVLEDLTLVARTGREQTREVTVRVVALPSVEDAWLSFEYPEYTGLPPDPPSRSITEVRALAGTRVRVRIKSNKPLKPDGARIVIEGAPPRALSPVRADANTPATHQGSFVLRKGMKWFRIEIEDTSGLTNKRHPRNFQVRVIEDRPPQVKIAEPGRETRCTPYALVPLDVRVKDDLAIRGAWLRFATGPKEEPRTQPFELETRRPKEAAITYRWDLSELRLKVGQTLSYRAEADDFRDTFPPGSKQTRQVGRSDPHYIRIVSPADLAGELDRERFALRDRLKKVKARQEDDRRKVRQLLRKLTDRQPMTNDDRALAADTENVQRELARSVRRIGTAIGRIRQRMENNRIGSFADRRRLEDIRAALHDVADAAMPRAAEFIKHARKDLASADGRSNLQNAAGVQAVILARLEKVLAQMSHNEDIDHLVRSARELLLTQRTLKDETAAFARRPGTFGAAVGDLDPADLATLNLLVRRQRGARDGMRNLEQDMLNVFERLRKDDPRRAEIVQRAQAGASRDQIRPMMEEAAGKLADNRIGLAASHQKSAVHGLERLLEALEAAREQTGSDEVLAQAIRDVKRALREVRRLLERQEGHLGDTREINRDAAQARKLKELRRKLARLRAEQDETNREAGDAAKLEPLAEPQGKRAEQTGKLAGELDHEADDADRRRAPQASDIRDASRASADAKSRMGAAKNGMQKQDGPKARQAGTQAGVKLAEADAHLADALKKIERKRLENTRETALKQGETAKEAEPVARLLRRLAKENQNASEEAAKGLDKAGGRVDQAHGSMRKAQASLDRHDTVQGEKEATEARDRLAEAQRELQKLRDELEKKQKEQTLLDLIVELQPMLEKQIGINDETRRIDDATVKASRPEPSRPDKVRLGQLASDESELANKAGRLLKKVEGENAPVFVWGFRKLVRDMTEIKDRLVAFKTDAYTQDVQQDAAETLRMLIDALKREQSKMREGGGGGGGGGGRPMLVPPSAQLKLLKARELEIHNKTKRIDLRRLLRPAKPLSTLQEKRVKRLAEEQAQLGALTTKLAESLEREVREHRKRMRELQEGNDR